MVPAGAVDVRSAALAFFFTRIVAAVIGVRTAYARLVCLGSTRQSRETALFAAVYFSVLKQDVSEGPKRRLLQPDGSRF